MDYRTKDTRREGSPQARRGEPGGQMAVVSRPLERTPFRRGWDDHAAGAGFGAARAQYPYDVLRDMEAEAPLVLIVEDEETIAEVLRLIVEEIGCRVVLAPNGAAALAIARREVVALVLTDLMMPVMDGRTFIARLHEAAERGEMAPTPVVVMTATGRVFARDLAVEGVLRKPFELDEVEAMVERFVGDQLRGGVRRFGGYA